MTTHRTHENREWLEYVQTADAMKALERLKATAAAMAVDDHPLAALLASGNYRALDALLRDLDAEAA